MLRVENKAGVTELYIYDEIGPAWAGMISGEAVVKALAEIGESPVIVRINSPGGDVFEGLTIYNALMRHPQVTVEVDGLAASAASLVAMAGATVSMAENAMMMVHNAWTVVAGNKIALRTTADVLEKVDGNIAQTYATRTGLSIDDIKTLLDAETWLTAQESVDKGFADEIGKPLAVSAKVRAGLFKNTPAQFLSDKPAESRTETPAVPRRTAARLQTLNARARVRV